MVEEVRRGRFLHNTAIVQKQHPAGNCPGKLHLVGDDHHGLALTGQVEHDIQHLAHHFRVKGGGHFVEQQDLRVHTERTYNGDTLLLTTRKLPGVAVLFGQQAHAVQQGLGFLLHLSPGAFLHLGGGQQDIFQHGQVREKLIALEHHADALAQGRQILAAVGDRLTAQLHPARLHRLQTVQTAQQGAFAAAGRAHHNDDLTGLDGKADIIQNIGLAIVAFYQMVYSQDRLCHNSHFHFFSR